MTFIYLAILKRTKENCCIRNIINCIIAGQEYCRGHKVNCVFFVVVPPVTFFGDIYLIKNNNTTLIANFATRAFNYDNFLQTNVRRAMEQYSIENNDCVNIMSWQSARPVV